MSKTFEERMARENAYDSGYDAGYYVGKRDGYIEAITDILEYLESHTNTPAIVIKRHMAEMKEKDIVYDYEPKFCPESSATVESCIKTPKRDEPLYTMDEICKMNDVEFNPR